MQLYLVRHGQSENNAGSTSSHNVPLTSLGQEQVSLLADAIADQRFDALYCSPLERALQSATILYSRLGIAPYVHPFFAETGFSGGEPDLLRDQMQSAYPHAILDPSITNSGWAPSDGESIEDVHNRAESLVQWLLERHPEPDSRILAVSHGHFGGVLICYLVGSQPLMGFTRFSQYNACISRIDIIGGQSKLRFLNSTCHLPEDMLT